MIRLWNAGPLADMTNASVFKGLLASVSEMSAEVKAVQKANSSAIKPDESDTREIMKHLY